MKPIQHPSRQGSALILTSIMLILLFGIAYSLTDLSVGNLRMGNQRLDELNATITAESLANVGLSVLQNRSDLLTELDLQRSRTAATDITPEATTAAARTGDGKDTLNGVNPMVAWKFLRTVSVPVYGVQQDQQVYQLTAVAASGGPATLYDANGNMAPIPSPERYARRRVEALFTPFPTNAFKQAMFAKCGYQFMGSATTDSWNSNNGTLSYAAAAKGSHGDLVSEGTILVQKPGNVQGQATTVADFPLPVFTYNPPGNALALPLSGTLSGGNYRGASLTITNSKTYDFVAGATVTIYIDGPLSITADWPVPAGCKVCVIQNNYSATLGGTTINGNITVGNINNPQSFMYMTLYDGAISGGGDGVDFKMNGTAKFGGVIFAPNSTFALNGTFDFYGALIANAFKDTTMGKVNGSFSFHYDEYLGSVPLPLPPTLVVVGWSAMNVTTARWRDQAAGVTWDAP